MTFAIGANTRHRLPYIAASVLILVHLALAALLFDPKPFLGGDSAGYIILAEALETGQGYRDLFLPNVPRHGLFPPFYPALLTLVAALGGGLITYKVLSTVFSTAAVAFAMLLGRSRLGWAGAFAVGLPVALSPTLLAHSHWILPDALFLLILLGCLWLTERGGERGVWIAAAFALATLAFLTRSGGLALLIALLTWLGWARRWRALAVASVVTLPVVLAWRVWTALATAGHDPTRTTSFLSLNPYFPQAGSAGPGELAARAVNNTREYVVAVLPESLAGLAPSGGLGLLALLAGITLIALALVGWTHSVRRMRPLESFTLLYSGIILIWPAAWADGRALLPLIPLAALHAAAGLGWFLSLSEKGRRAWALPTLGAVLALLAAPSHVSAVATNQRCLSFYRLGDQLACYPTHWRAFVQTALWVKDNTPSEAIVISERPRVYYLFSERRGVQYPYTSEDAQMLAYLDEIRADFVVGGGPGPATARYLVPVVLSVPGRFELRYRVPDRSTPAFVLGYRRSRAVEAGQGGGK